MSVKDHNTAYRRGVLLGLTMAEIIILVVFLLMLAFATMLKEKEKEYALLNQDKTYLDRVLRHKDYIDRIITVLEQNEPDISEEMVRAVEGMPDVIKMIRKKDVVKGEGETISDVLIRGVDKLETKAEAEAKADAEESDVPVEQQIAELKSEVGNLTDQKKYLMEQVDRLSNGRGVDPPPCWKDSNGRWSEYIFNIDLTSKGIIVHDNALPHRAEEQARLPLQGMKYNALMSVSDFRSASEALFSWSVKKDCRFSVRVYDQTGASEKALYKQLLDTVRGAFIPYEVKSKTNPLPSVEQSEDKDQGSFFGKLFKSPEKKSRKEEYN